MRFAIRSLLSRLLKTWEGSKGHDATCVYDFLVSAVDEEALLDASWKEGPSPLPCIFIVFRVDSVQSRWAFG